MNRSRRLVLHVLRTPTRPQWATPCQSNPHMLGHLRKLYERQDVELGFLLSFQVPRDGANLRRERSTTSCSDCEGQPETLAFGIQRKRVEAFQVSPPDSLLPGGSAQQQ